MTDPLRAPREDDAGAVARLMSESWPEPVGEVSVLHEWTFPGGVPTSRNDAAQTWGRRRGLTGANKLYESVGMRVSDCFDVYEKVVA